MPSHPITTLRIHTTIIVEVQKRVLDFVHRFFLFVAISLGCFINIDSYVGECLWVTNVEGHHAAHCCCTMVQVGLLTADYDNNNVTKTMLFSPLGVHRGKNVEKKRVQIQGRLRFWYYTHSIGLTKLQPDRPGGGEGGYPNWNGERKRSRLLYHIYAVVMTAAGSSSCSSSNRFMASHSDHS